MESTFFRLSTLTPWRRNTFLQLGCIEEEVTGGGDDAFLDFVDLNFGVAGLGFVAVIFCCYEGGDEGRKEENEGAAVERDRCAE